MYPLNTERPWPINQWYAAGFSSEVDRVIRRRTFLGRRVVMFRDEAGVAQAVSGICPHRMMPMEEGRLDGNNLVCGYHGLNFDVHTGKCVKSPGSVTVPQCSLISYPVREVGPLLWIWMGLPERAETTPIPPQASIGIGCEGWVTQCVDYKMLKARYCLLVDNLFDLSHLCFVHGSIVGDTVDTLCDLFVEKRDGRLVVYREVIDVPGDQFDRFNHPEYGERVSRRSETELLGVSLINAGTRSLEGPNLEEHLGGNLNFIHLLTPETENTTHYWVMLTRDFRTDDADYSRQIAEMQIAVIDQDREALEKIEVLLQSAAGVPREISMRSDIGAIQARRRVADMIKND